MKPSGIGGQAVLEGVMMKNKERYAVAVRKPDHEIVVEVKEYHSIKEKQKWLGLPFLRGIVAFVESMVVGMKTLTYSASFFEEEGEEKPGKVENGLNKVFKDKAESVLMGFTVVCSIALAVAIFMLLPFFAANLLSKQIESRLVLTAIEGVIRLALFIGYVCAISLMRDIKRVFMYHGAEHKSINCIENGYDLTVANVKRQTTQHKRCGTSFMLFVMILSVIFFMFIQVDSMWMRLVFRILLIPFIAGLSFEFIQLAGRTSNPVIGILSKPGLWLQKLTTREPDEEMIEVAIRSVEEVFDWKPFVEGIKKEKQARRKSKKQDTDSELEQIEKTIDEKVKKPNRKESIDKETAAAVEPQEDLDKDADQPAAVDMAESADMPEPGAQEEEDEILNALDRFFTFQGEKDIKGGRNKK